MGLGIALGGVAKGIESAENTALAKRKLTMGERALAHDMSIADQNLALKRKELAQNQFKLLAGEAEKLIAANLKIVGEVADKSREAGHTPEQIAAVVEPLLADVDALSARIGKDSGSIRAQANALIGIPQKPNTFTVGATLESIKAKLATGQPLNEGEQMIYNDARRLDKWQRTFLGLDISGKSDADAEPTSPPLPETPPAPAAPAASPAPVPPVPTNLAGKPGVAWSPSRQRWYLPDGSSFNQQGVPIAPAVPTAPASTTAPGT